MIDNLLTHGPGEWLLGEGPHAGIVVSTRIRLARNVSGYRFSPKMTGPEAEELLAFLKKQTERLPGADFLYTDLRELNPVDSLVLVERHLISKELEVKDGPRGVAVKPGEKISLMFLEEDHLRIQIMTSGLSIQPGWQCMQTLENQLSELIPMAFDDEYGYLTTCPTNVGTGIRVSTMLHLPGLVITRQIERAYATAQKIQMVVRGLYGEGSRPASDLFQISNQVTLGRTEEDICSELQQVVEKIVAWEEETRRQLKKENGTELEDKTARAIGTLESARTITSEEALQLLSSIRMGLHLGITQQLSLQNLNQIFLLVQPGHLQKIAGTPLDPQERDRLRAEKLRELMA